MTLVPAHIGVVDKLVGCVANEITGVTSTVGAMTLVDVQPLVLLAVTV
jgi:hypothetical protein